MEPPRPIPCSAIATHVPTGSGGGGAGIGGHCLGLCRRFRRGCDRFVRPAEVVGTATELGAQRDASSVSVGAISTITGVGAGDFVGLIPGVQAYFDMVNAQGGINGRKLVLAHSLDDGGSPSTFSQLAHTLVQQDHLFAAFISTFWFTPNLFVESGTPTYGYDVTGNWSGSPNLFGAGGSTLDYQALPPPVAYFVKRTGSHSVGLISYGKASPVRTRRATPPPRTWRRAGSTWPTPTSTSASAVTTRPPSSRWRPTMSTSS